MDEFHAEEALFLLIKKLCSNLNVTLTCFLCQSMKPDILRRNQVFCCRFPLFDAWKQLRLMFVFCLLTHIIWNCIYVTLTQSLYAWQGAILEFLFGTEISAVSWELHFLVRQNGANQCRTMWKYRTDNNKKFQLVAAMQQFKRAKELASGTPEAEKMRKAAALKKRVQRMREK